MARTSYDKGHVRKVKMMTRRRTVELNCVNIKNEICQGNDKTKDTIYLCFMVE